MKLRANKMKTVELYST